MKEGKNTQENTEEKEWVCPKCNTKNHKNFCNNCGFPYSELEIHNNSILKRMQIINDKFNRSIRHLFILILVIVIGNFSYTLYQNKENKQPIQGNRKFEEALEQAEKDSVGIDETNSNKEKNPEAYRKFYTTSAGLILLDYCQSINDKDFDKAQKFLSDENKEENIFAFNQKTDNPIIMISPYNLKVEFYSLDKIIFSFKLAVRREKDLSKQPQEYHGKAILSRKEEKRTDKWFIDSLTLEK